MKESELRIGNWVNCKIYNGNSNVNIQFDSFESKYIHLFEPIPLTEEWFVKLGFEKYTNSIGGDSFRIYSEKRISEPVLDYDIKNGYCAIQGRVSNVLNRVKYVHQIQNIYFALTGEELKTKA